MSLPELTFWIWLALGLVLFALELLAPLTYFLWLGASAIVTALILFVIPDLSWEAQFVIFSVLAVISIIISRKYLVSKIQTETDQPNLNLRAQQYIGRVFVLSEEIHQGFGKVQVDDSYWKVRGPALSKGSEVRVVGAEGSVLDVESVDKEV